MNMNPTALWIIIDNDENRKQHFINLSRRSQSEANLAERIRESLAQIFDEWHESIAESALKHGCYEWDMLMFAMLQSAIERIDDETVNKLAHHYWSYK